jgi:hypothetical protein
VRAVRAQNVSAPKRHRENRSSPVPTNAGSEYLAPNRPQPNVAQQHSSSRRDSPQIPQVPSRDVEKPSRSSESQVDPEPLHAKGNNNRNAAASTAPPDTQVPARQHVRTSWEGNAIVINHSPVVHQSPDEATRVHPQVPQTPSSSANHTPVPPRHIDHHPSMRFASDKTLPRTPRPRPHPPADVVPRFPYRYLQHPAPPSPRETSQVRPSHPPLPDLGNGSVAQTAYKTFKETPRIETETQPRPGARDLWPELPEAQSPAADAWLRDLADAEHSRALNAEQRGGR